ncbi:MAG: His/Gly/Thr/Pro-type tRNA ligase C-terminal domain-containing protein, partial [Pseudomonadota bacterium]|nr:His/Gly/Thr/Pro-type tRNA ligase C-terminal domain-containing protein [Pseudomonadota bacterium]
DNLYEKLNLAGLDVLYEDRDERPGTKFADMDLIGVPWQIVVGPRGVKNGVVELKSRASGKREETSSEAVLARLAG